MVRQKVRVRFRKESDLRLIGHRDLARTWERIIRRAGFVLHMSEGMRPRPKLNLPSALAVGIAGVDEVLEMEFDLAEPRTMQQLHEALAPHLPPGLAITAVEPLPCEHRATHVQRVRFELPVPQPRQEQVERRIGELLARDVCLVARGEGHKEVDLRQYIEHLGLASGRLEMQLKVTNCGTARPREVLAALGLDDLEQHGYYLTRTAVELEP